jgi:hypothetical protein
MVLPWHRNDYSKLPDEDRFAAAVRPLGIPPGDYAAPRPADMNDMKTPAFMEKIKAGPVIVMTVRPNEPMAMGKMLGQWFVYSLVVGFFAAYVAAAALPPGAPYPRVFQVVSMAAFAGYSLALWPLSIWFGRRWATTVRSTIDGLVYALLTAGVFGWLWPH